MTLFDLRAAKAIGEGAIWSGCELSGGEARKGVSEAYGYFMGYYTIWLARVKKIFVPFWELSGECRELY
jgi:hypothetical protein